MQGAPTRLRYGVIGATRKLPHKMEKELATLSGMAFDLLGAIEEHEIVPLIHSCAGQNIVQFDEVKVIDLIMEELVEEATRAVWKQKNFFSLDPTRVRFSHWLKQNLNHHLKPKPKPT